METTLGRVIVCVGVLAMVTGCSSAPDTPPAPTTCKRTDRTGTYRVTFTEQSGTCGPLDSTLVSFNQDDGTATAGCKLHSDVWSEGDCKNERTFTCVSTISDPTQWGGRAGLTIDYVSVSRQQTANGSQITGTMSVRLSSTSGDACTSTYGVDFVRQ